MTVWEKRKAMFRKRRQSNRSNKQGRHYIAYLFILLGIVACWLGSNRNWLTVSPLTRLKHQPFVVTEEFVEEANQYLEASQQPMPLILQTDERWYYESYGTDERDNFLGINGCALASLAMVGSYWQDRLIEPVEILGWAQNYYYLPGQGTMWSIFSDYAHAIGLTAQDLGNDFATAKHYITLGYPVLVSVKPGYFTDVGHIMVLMTDDSGEIVVFDPDDSPEKNHYAQTFSDELLLTESINYWVYQ